MSFPLRKLPRILGGSALVGMLGCDPSASEEGSPPIVRDTVYVLAPYAVYKCPEDDTVPSYGKTCGDVGRTVCTPAGTLLLCRSGTWGGHYDSQYGCMLKDGKYEVVYRHLGYIGIDRMERRERPRRLLRQAA